MNTQNNNEINIGIDTGQAMLDIHVRPTGEFQSVENNPEGIRTAIRFIRKFKPDRVLIEATGRLEMAFFCAAYKAGLPVCVCNPIQVRKFAQAIGRMAKTDKLDAQDIAYYGETIKPAFTDLKPEKLPVLICNSTSSSVKSLTTRNESINSSVRRGWVKCSPTLYSVTSLNSGS